MADNWGTPPPVQQQFSWNNAPTQSQPQQTQHSLAPLQQQQQQQQQQHSSLPQPSQPSINQGPGEKNIIEINTDPSYKQMQSNNNVSAKYITGQNPTKKVFHTVDIRNELDPVDLAILTLLQQKYSFTIIFPGNKGIPPPSPQLKQLIDYFINRKQNGQNSNSQGFSKTDLEKSSYTRDVAFTPDNKVSNITKPDNGNDYDNNNNNNIVETITLTQDANTPQDSLISFDDNTNDHEFTPKSQQNNKYDIFGLAKRSPVINPINNNTPVSVNASHDKSLKDLISNNNVPQQLVVQSPINDNYVAPSINSSFTVEPQNESNYPANTVSNQGYWNENDSNQVDWIGSIGQKENTNSTLKKGRIDYNTIYHDQNRVINDEFSDVTKQDTNDKLMICYNCNMSGHQSLECQEKPNTEILWKNLIKADTDKDLDMIKKIFDDYTKAAPDETFQSMERKFRESKCNVRIIALDRGEVPADKTLVDIQGHVGKKYFAHIMIGPPACIPIDYGQIAEGDEENNSWLADAGFLKDKNSIEMCITCNKSGHSSNNCPKIENESNQKSFTSLSCQSCGSTEHTTKSCNRGVYNKDNKDDDDYYYSKSQEPKFNNNNNNNNNNGKLCFRCGSPNHIARNCSDDTSRSNSERRYSRSSNSGGSGFNNNNNNIEKAAATWGVVAEKNFDLDNVAIWWKK